jgi:hypothetical protein
MYDFDDLRVWKVIFQALSRVLSRTSGQYEKAYEHRSLPSRGIHHAALTSGALETCVRSSGRTNTLRQLSHLGSGPVEEDSCRVEVRFAFADKGATW